MSQVKRYVTTCDCMSEASWGDYVRHSDYAALEAECERLREALRMARLFIRNGIDLGYIKMPDDDTPDPAQDNLPMIDAALSTTP